MTDTRNAQGVPKTRIGFPWSKIIDTLAGGAAAAHGDVLYRAGSQWTRLAPGTAGRVLATGGGAADPSWASLSALANTTYAIHPSADETKTLDDTLAADAALVATLAANSKYRLRFDVYFDSAATPDVKWDLNFTGTTTSVLWKAITTVLATADLPTGGSTGTITLRGASSLGITIALLGTASNTFFNVITVAIETGASGGVFSLRWAQNTSSATAITRRRNSALLVTDCT